MRSSKGMQQKYFNYVRTIYSGPFSPAAQRIRTLANSSKTRSTAAGAGASYSPTGNYFPRAPGKPPYLGWLKSEDPKPLPPEKIRVRIPQMQKSSTASILSSSRSIQQHNQAAKVMVRPPTVGSR